MGRNLGAQKSEGICSGNTLFLSNYPHLPIPPMHKPTSYRRKVFSKKERTTLKYWTRNLVPWSQFRFFPFMKVRNVFTMFNSNQKDKARFPDMKKFIMNDESECTGGFVTASAGVKVIPESKLKHLVWKSSLRFSRDWSTSARPVMQDC